MIKVASNLERIGDYSKNMAKRTTVLMEMPHVFDKGQGLRRLAREVELMLKDALDAYVQRDVKLAEEVIQRDRDVDQMYSGQFREFLTYMMEDPRNITPCMHLHFIAKNIERMGDHVTSIAEQVIYIVTGDRPTEEREKKDKTSADANISLDLSRVMIRPTVLLVEDEPAQREMLAYNLEAEGFDVITADNGEDGLILVDENDPDLIVLDWMMPQLSGIEVCRRLKAIQKHAKSLSSCCLHARKRWTVCVGWKPVPMITS